MSNKLVKHQETKEILTGKQKKILFWSCFIILSIVFVAVWVNIFLTSKAFNTQMEEMVLGEDYYMEDVVITDKRLRMPRKIRYLRIIFSTTTMGKRMIIISECRYRNLYIQNMM